LYQIPDIEIVKVALFIPCYIDQLYPQVGVATIELLEKLSVDVHYPSSQTCCGQPMANSGCEQDSKSVYDHFVKTFSEYDYIVTPSGSCAYHIKKHYDNIDQTTQVKHVRERTIELVQFITEVLGVRKLDGNFPYRVGLHISCHGQRGLKQGTASEYTAERENATAGLLSSLQNIQLTALTRYDECCGFGGTFCISEEAVSSRMGVDRIMDHWNAGTQVLTGNDMSCLMHMQGILKRNLLPIQVMHVAEILNGDTVKL
jgi:L-lactate dehydrogenase complex protein LldE